MPVVIAVGLVAANVAWFAGLIRLFGEAVARLIPELNTSDGEKRTVFLVIIVAATVLGVEAFLAWRWARFRGFLLQSQEDIRRLWGVPPKARPRRQINLRRPAAASAMVLVPALVLASLMPGAAAAAIALVIGLVARVAVVVLSARTATA
jgi:hypothetical protein